MSECRQEARVITKGGFPVTEEIQLYRALIAKKGISNQLVKVAEEASELAQAALKLMQSQDPVEFSQRRRDLAEEIADNQLLAEQLIDHYQLSDLIFYFRTLKLRKIKQLIGEETEQ